MNAESRKVDKRTSEFRLQKLDDVTLLIVNVSPHYDAVHKQLGSALSASRNAQQETLDELLEQEWGLADEAERFFCPICGHQQEFGHAPACWLAALIAKLEKELQP